MDWLVLICLTWGLTCGLPLSQREDWAGIASLVSSIHLPWPDRRKTTQLGHGRDGGWALVLHVVSGPSSLPMTYPHGFPRGVLRIFTWQLWSSKSRSWQVCCRLRPKLAQHHVWSTLLVRVSHRDTADSTWERAWILRSMVHWCLSLEANLVLRIQCSHRWGQGLILGQENTFELPRWC